MQEVKSLLNINMNYNGNNNEHLWFFSLFYTGSKNNLYNNEEFKYMEYMQGVQKSFIFLEFPVSIDHFKFQKKRK
jgi:hypothetical protein